MPTITVAIDYDETFTTCRETWTKIIELLRTSGATVFCISARFPNCPITDFPGTVYYACGQAKGEYAEDNGLKVDVWIDDWPSCIGEVAHRRGVESPQAKIRRDIVKRLMSQLRFS